MKGSETQSPWIARAGLAAALAALLMLLLVHLRHPLRIGFDQALYVYAGSMLLQGKSLYVDVVDINPPLISYLNMIPAAVSSMFNTPAPLAFSLWVWSLCCYCTGMVFYLLARVRLKPDPLTPAALAASIPLFNLLMQTTIVEMLFVYGQREHLFMLAYLPFFCLRLIKQEGTPVSARLSIIVGLIAGIFMCLKPYFILVAALVEIFWLIERRNWKLLLAPENIVIALVAVVYVLHFWFLPCDVYRAYFDGIAAVGLIGYKVYDIPTIFMCNYNSTRAASLFLTSLVCVASTLALTRFNQFLPSLCALALATYFNYFIQSKGWPYHILPLRITTFCLASLLIAVVLKQAITAWKPRFQKLSFLTKILRPESKWLFPLLVFGSTSSIYFCIMKNELIVAQSELFDLAEIGYQGSAPETDLGHLSGFVRDYTEPGDPVAILNTSTEPAATLLLQLNRKPAGRHVDEAELCYFDYIKGKHPDLWKTGFEKLHKEYMDTLISDILKSQPKLILLRMTVLKPWLEEQGFTKRVLEGRYRKIKEFRNYEVYILQKP